MCSRCGKRQATVHRTVAFRLFKFLWHKNNTHRMMGVIFMAEKEGFVCIFACGKTQTKRPLIPYNAFTILSCGAEKEGFVCIFAVGENKGSPSSSRWRQRSSALHLDRSNPTLAKRNDHPLGGHFFWRRRRDLNPRYPFGVYTISNRARSASYATSPYATAIAVSQVILLHLTPFVKS